MMPHAASLANVPLKLRSVHDERSENFKVSNAQIHVFALYVECIE